MSTC
jgi:hypothetical protein